MREASTQAGLRRAEFEAACLGFSGGPADKETLVRELLSARHLTVTIDAVVALAGACAGEPGLITIAGTGSIALGGDEGAAFDIVRQALRAALRFEEGWGPETRLRAILLEAAGGANADELMHTFYTAEWPRSRVAKFARLVDDAARDGDEAAGQVMDGAARALAGLAEAVRGQLFGDDEPARVSFIGGVFRSRRLLEGFERLTRAAHGCDTVGPPEFGPAAGALIEAYRAAGLKVRPTQLPEFEK